MRRNTELSYSGALCWPQCGTTASSEPAYETCPSEFLLFDYSDICSEHSRCLPGNLQIFESVWKCFCFFIEIWRTCEYLEGFMVVLRGICFENVFFPRESGNVFVILGETDWKSVGPQPPLKSGRDDPAASPYITCCSSAPGCPRSSLTGKKCSKVPVFI